VQDVQDVQTGTKGGLGALDRRQRLQLVFAALAVWQVIGVLVPLIEGNVLFDLTSNGSVDGVLGGRLFAGDAAVLAVLYARAAQKPDQSRYIAVLAIIQQLVAVVTVALTMGAGTLQPAASVLPLVVAASALAALLLWFPEKSGSGVVPR
jgi:hypothetical protein